MKTASQRKRAWMLLAATLLIANLAVWAPQVLVTPTLAASNSPAPACQAGSTPAAADAAARSWALANDIDFAMVTDPPCLGCSHMFTSGQLWCMMRPQLEIHCDPDGFGNNNYLVRRDITVLDCGGSGIRAQCGLWFDYGCCNWSFSQPPCATVDTVGLCTGALPPN